MKMTLSPRTIERASRDVARDGRERSREPSRAFGVFPTTRNDGSIDADDDANDETTERDD
jgi:hypothetical protein|tara:strand:- start:212 stop:391 length:180 start_codon:yes stop_codon:yes gene_type:complete